MTRNISDRLPYSGAGVELRRAEYFTTFGEEGVNVRAFSSAQLESYADDGIISLYYRGALTAPQFTSDDTLANPDRGRDFASIANNRVFNAIIRISATYFNGLLDTKLLLDRNTGRLRPEETQRIKGNYLGILDVFREGRHISGFNVLIPPDQTPLTNGDKLDVQLSAVPLGYANEIVLTVGYAARV